MSESPTHEQYFNGMEWEESFGYSQGLRTGDIVYVSGQVPHDAAGTLVGEGDMSQQARQVFENVDHVLESLGASRNHVVRTDVFLVDLRANFAAFSAEHLAYFGAHRPTSTTVGVIEMAMPGQLVEVAVTAHLSSR